MVERLCIVCNLPIPIKQINFVGKPRIQCKECFRKKRKFYDYNRNILLKQSKHLLSK